MKIVILCLLCSLITPFNKSILNKTHNDCDLFYENNFQDSEKANICDYQKPRQNQILINDNCSYQPGNYHQQTNFNLYDYFNNLYTYSPDNSVGSCGFVSLIQLMSYYDTFYNDNIIPEDYDCHLLNEMTEQLVSLSSPGVLRQKYTESLGYSYYTFCHNTITTNFQSKLTIVYNQLNGTDNDSMLNGNPVFEATLGGWEYHDLLESFYGNDLIFNISSYQGLSNASYVDLIKNFIDNEKPVVVHIKNDSLAKYHSVVAYDYDSTTIYANFGYGSAYTHLSLFDLLYTDIYGVYALDFYSMPHVHSNNYVFSGKGHCGCNLDDSILFLSSPIFTNFSPTIFWMRDKNYSNEQYHLCIQDVDSGEELLAYNLAFNYLTISLTDWIYILSFGVGDLAFILTRYNYDFGYESCTTVIEHPYLAKNNFSIFQSEYGYQDSYPSNEIENVVTKNTDYFSTKRLRCGYIHNEFINLSPRRVNAGTAYLEYTFPYDVFLFEISISMWSYNECVSGENATALIQYKNTNNEYITLVDLFNDFTISQNRLKQDHLSITLPTSVKTIRIFTSADAIGNNNKGRISIGELRVVYA